ncbi:MAG: hypothetical protein GY794_24275 [bacterium]|nr:hypothetical protein [bacterium]
MIEIIVIVGVVRWFVRTAARKGKNAAVWGIIGVVSYYVPIIVFGHVIYPEIIKDSITYENQDIYIIVGVLLNLAIGIGCCLFAGKVLLLEPDDNTTQDRQ